MHLPSKPAPDGFLKGAEILGLTTEQCLVIEDAPAGVASAKAAGMKCLAVGTSNPLENLRAADLVTPTLEDLHEADVLSSWKDNPPALYPHSEFAEGCRVARPAPASTTSAYITIAP